MKEQIENVLSKLKIVDSSIDRDAVGSELLEYYKTKFEGFNPQHFEYDFINLFCGAGGLSVGLEQVGFKPIIAVDKDESSLLTYRFNRPWLSAESLINEDIRNLTDKEVFPHVPLVVGGPPCQGFSIAGPRDMNDKRNSLYSAMVISSSTLLLAIQ